MEGVALMFEVIGKGARARLEANAKLMPADFADIAKRVGTAPVQARKVGYVAARKAMKREVVETRWNGKETTNTAKAGDYILTNLLPQRKPLRDSEGKLNTYVITARRFADLYEPTGEESALGPIYRAKGVVSALSFPGGFDIVAPWGERQTGSAGYLLLSGEEVYGASAEAFATTYEIVGT